MKPYKSLGITVIDSDTTSWAWVTVYMGEDIHTACRIQKGFPLDEIPEGADWLAWVSMAFLQAADQLTEEGWEFRHSAECPEPHLAVADA